MKKSMKMVDIRSASITKRLAAGGIGVTVLAVGLSIALAKGIFSSPATNDAAQRYSVDHVLTMNASTPSTVDREGEGMSALERAATDNKYLFAFFSRANDNQTTAMKKIFEEATAKVADRAQSVVVSVTNPAESGIVKKFELDRAPMPLVLAIAPNGAIMGGFPTKFEVNDLLNAFGSSCTEQCMKSLQDGKLVLLCVQNSSTKSNAEAIQGVNEFKADEKYSAATEIVMLDPTDPAESPFLGDLKIDPKTTVAVTAFLAPPGSVIAEYQGAIAKDQLIAALEQANTGCGPGGCGPGGCAPK